MDISMLPTIPDQPDDQDEVSLVGITFAGANHEALASFFVCCLNGVAAYGDHLCPTIGDLQIGPHHVMDSIARDFQLLPDDLTSITIPMGVCCVRESLPACATCEQPARYDIWATSWQPPLLLCVTCAEPLEGQDLGTGSATYIYRIDELSSSTRAWCDAVAAELGRPSAWADTSTDEADIR